MLVFLNSKTKTISADISTKLVLFTIKAMFEYLFMLITEISHGGILTYLVKPNLGQCKNNSTLPGELGRLSGKRGKVVIF